MELIELIFMTLGVLAVLAASISITTNISSFYRVKYGFSVWSGVLFLSVGFIILLLCSTSDSCRNGVYILIPLILCIFTIIRDIRLAGFVYGFLGFLFQAVMSFLVFFVIILIIALAFARMVTRSTRRFTGRYSNALREMRYAIVLFPVFIKI